MSSRCATSVTGVAVAFGNRVPASTGPMPTGRAGTAATIIATGAAGERTDAKRRASALRFFVACGAWWNLNRGTRDPQLRCSTITNLEEEEPNEDASDHDHRDWPCDGE